MKTDGLALLFPQTYEWQLNHKAEFGSVKNSSVSCSLPMNQIYEGLSIAMWFMLCTFLVVGIIEMITMIIIMTNQRVAMLFLTKVSFECLSLCVSNLILSLYCFKRTDTSNIFGHRIFMTWQNSKLQDLWFKFLTWTGTCQVLFFGCHENHDRP